MFNFRLEFNIIKIMSSQFSVIDLINSFQMVHVEEHFYLQGEEEVEFYTHED